MLKFMLKSGQNCLEGGLVKAFASWFVNKLTESRVDKLANYSQTELLLENSC